MTADAVKGFADEQLAGIMGEEITVDTLPEIDRSEINILEQNYDSLSEEKRKAKQKEDAAKYLEEMLYACKQRTGGSCDKRRFCCFPGGFYFSSQRNFGSWRGFEIFFRSRCET